MGDEPIVSVGTVQVLTVERVHPGVSLGLHRNHPKCYGPLKRTDGEIEGLW